MGLVGRTAGGATGDWAEVESAIVISWTDRIGQMVSRTRGEDRTLKNWGLVEIQ